MHDFICFWPRPVSAPFVVGLSLLFILFAGGCEQAGDIMDDVAESAGEAVDSVSETVSEQVESASGPSDPASAEQATVTTDPGTPTTPQPDPQALIAQLNSLKPYEITTEHLQQIAAVPEAAALVTELKLDQAQVTADGLSALRAFVNLQSLSLQDVQGQAPMFASLQGVSSLETLSLMRTMADNSTLTALSSSSNLKNLKLDGSRIQTGAGAILANMPLESLSAEGTGFADADAAAISGLKLRSLNLKSTSISDAGLVELAKIRTLEDLSVENTGVNGQTFVAFRGSQLQSLNASWTNFGTVGLQAIKNLKQLETLKLYRAGIVENLDANVFKTFPKLKMLGLSENRISDRGVQVLLVGHKSLEHLDLDLIPTISDASLGLLLKNRALKYLDVEGSNCTPQGVQLFHKERPDCFIRGASLELGPKPTLEDAATAPVPSEEETTE